MASLAFFPTGWADFIVSDGVLGNSGEAAETLVKFSEAAPVGAGIGVDDDGFLWATGGRGRVNRYAADGRLLGTYLTPGSTDVPKAITTAAGQVVLLANGMISTLPVNSRPGSRFESWGCAADLMSRSSIDGTLAIWKSGKLSLLYILTKTSTPFSEVAEAASIELGSDHSVYIESPTRISARAMQPRGRVSRIMPDGQPDPEWPKDLKGKTPVRIGEQFFSFDPHGTVNRLDSSLAADPGPVTGGTTGSFLGRLAIDPDLGTGSGMARWRGETYALAGEKGSVLLASWDASRGELKIGRRLGALPACEGLAISKGGEVLAAGGVWGASARPDSPLEFGLTVDPGGFKQPCESAQGSFIVPCFSGQRAGFAVFDFQSEPKFWEVATNPFSRKAVGAITAPLNGEEAVIVVEPDGKGHAYQLRADGKLQRSIGEVSFKATTSIRQLSAVSRADGGMFFAAIDGVVVEFELRGKEFVETDRWEAGGKSEASGQPIYLSVDGSNLWVSETAKNRVLCLDQETRKLIGTYEPAPRFSLQSPTRIASRNGRAVVYDQGNQRILRLQLQKEN